MPQPSRRIRKLIPPRRRNAWSQPAIWMRWPTCAATSTERIRPSEGAEADVVRDERDERVDDMRNTPVECSWWPAVRVHVGKSAPAGQPHRRIGLRRLPPDWRLRYRRHHPSRTPPQPLPSPSPAPPRRGEGENSAHTKSPHPQHFGGRGLTRRLVVPPPFASLRIVA